MGIYHWQQGSIRRVDTHKDQAVIHYPDDITPDQIVTLARQFSNKGYTVSQTEIPAPSTHKLQIQGDPAGLSKLKAAMEKEVAGRGRQKDVTVTLDGNALTVHNLKNDIETTAFRRWSEWKGFSPSKGYTFSHEKNTPNPSPALLVRGIDDEEKFLKTVEQNGAEGERRDQYYGLSPFRKSMAKLQDTGARKWASLLYLAGDLFLGAGGWKEAARQQKSFHELPLFKEFIGFFSGSMFMFWSALKEEPTVSDVMKRFNDVFKKGAEGYDFGQSEDMPDKSRSLGRLPERMDDFMRDNGQEVHFALGALAGTGAWGSGKLPILKMQKAADGSVNAVLNKDTGNIEKTDRLMLQNYISGALVTSGSLAEIFMPQDGKKPLIDYTAINDRLRDTPVIGSGIRAIDGFAKTTVGKAIGYVPGKAMQYLRQDIFAVIGRMFFMHNVGQVVFGIRDYFQRGQEYKQFSQQMLNEASLLTDGKLAHPAGESGFESLTDGRKVLQDKAFANALSDIYNTADPVLYKQHIKDYLDKVERGGEVSEADRYIAVKAFNRQYFEELQSERSTVGNRFTGYFTYLMGHVLLSKGDSTYTKEVNAAAAKVDLHAVCRDIASVLREENMADNPSAIRNTAAFVFSQKALQGNGLGIDEISGIISAYAEGKDVASASVTGVERSVDAQVTVLSPQSSLATVDKSGEIRNMADVLTLQQQTQNQAIA